VSTSGFARQLFEDSGLAASPEPVAEPLVAALVERHYGLGGEFERLATEKDDTFRLRTGSGDHLVKVSPPGEPAEVVALQTAAMRFLEDTAPELPVQRVTRTSGGADHVVLTTHDGEPRVLRVFGFVAGTVLAQANPAPAQLTRAGEVLGRLDRALAAFAHPADGRRLVWDIRHFARLTELTESTSDTGHVRLAREVFRRFETAVVPHLGHLETQVIHGDFSPHNVVVDPQRDDYVIGIIDFGDTVRSAVVFDPAVPMANLLGRTPHDPWLEARAFAEGYTRVRPLGDREIPVLPVAALARLTLRALITDWRAQRAPHRRDYLLGHAKDDWTNVERVLSAPDPAFRTENTP